MNKKRLTENAQRLQKQIKSLRGRIRRCRASDSVDSLYQIPSIEEMLRIKERELQMLRNQM